MELRNLNDEYPSRWTPLRTDYRQYKRLNRWGRSFECCGFLWIPQLQIHIQKRVHANQGIANCWILNVWVSTQEPTRWAQAEYCRCSRCDGWQRAVRPQSHRGFSAVNSRKHTIPTMFTKALAEPISQIVVVLEFAAVRIFKSASRTPL